MVERAGKGQTYFYAPMSEYKGKSPIWSKYPTAMILKVAESYALRKAFSISGVVSQEEVDAGQAPEAPKVEPVVTTEPDWGDDADLETWQAGILEHQDEKAWPMEWRPTKVNALLTKSTPESRTALLDELNDKLAKATSATASGE